MKQFSTIIVGAGAAGLSAASELSQQESGVLILEARGRTGGRIRTVQDVRFSMPLEAGAEFIHGDMPFTIQLLKEAGIAYVPVRGEIWQKRKGILCRQEDFIDDQNILSEKLQELEHDMTVATFLERYLAGRRYEALRNEVRGFVEGYDAADIGRASVMALKAELQSDEEQYRIPEGYAALTSYLEKKCRDRGCTILTDSIVRRIMWKKGEVVVILQNGTKLTADKLLITVPLGVLTAGEHADGGIRFEPAIPEKIQAAAAIGFGTVIKYFLEFKEPFWQYSMPGKDLSRLGFLFSEASVPTWWTQEPARTGLLTGWLAGPRALSNAAISGDQLLEAATDAAAEVFECNPSQLRQTLKAASMYNWSEEPFSRGAYSYATVEGNIPKKILAEPVADTIFFAGEGVYFGPYGGTVEAAIASGIQVSNRMMQTSAGSEKIH